MTYSRWLVGVFLLLPLSVLAFFKPVRALISEAFGVRCNEQNLLGWSTLKIASIGLCHFRLSIRPYRPQRAYCWS